MAARTTPAMNVKSVAKMSRGPKIMGFASPGLNAAANPYSRTSHEKTQTKMAKLTLDELPEKADAMTLPINAVVRRVNRN